MSKPSTSHPFRETMNNNPIHRLPTGKRTEKQVKTKQVRDRIEELKAKKEFDALFGE